MQVGTDYPARTDRETTGGRTPSLLLACLAAAETGQEQERAFIEAFLQQQVARRTGVAALPLVAAGRVQQRLADYLQQTDRLLLMPFGVEASGTLRSVIEPCCGMLRDATGEDVSRTQFTAPYATTVRPVFAPMEGLADPQRQLDPLVRTYPGWHSPYLCLGAGSKRIVFLCGQHGEAPRSDGVADSTLIAMLANSLCQHESRWKRDGDILASFLASLAGTVLTEVFACESTINAAPPSSLLPPWLAE